MGKEEKSEEENKRVRNELALLGREGKGGEVRRGRRRTVVYSYMYILRFLFVGCCEAF